MSIRILVFFLLCPILILGLGSCTDPEPYPKTDATESVPATASAPETRTDAFFETDAAQTGSEETGAEPDSEVETEAEPDSEAETEAEPDSEAETEPATFRRISQDEAGEMMLRDDGHLILDVRMPYEYESGHIPGAICLPNESIGTEPPKELPDRDQILLVYCRSGRRSLEAAQKLADLGYTNVFEFGGILDWTGETVIE